MFSKKVLPPTAKRVFIHTHPHQNIKIRNRTIANLDKYSNSSQAVLSNRIKQLDEEWDTERILEANAAALVLITSIIGLKSGRGWFLLSGAIGAFLLQHALQGWCPPLPVIRKMGTRTAEEIYNEKFIHKMVRGDFLYTHADMVEALNRVEK